MKNYAEQFAIAAELMAAGIDLQRQNLRRRWPGASEAEIARKLQAWLWRADDAIPGDVSGAVRERPWRS
ncbi:MAG: hypothetical protein K9N49_08955 [Candidatus Marinimicrobia bacterium]|nr:hypothetical protein [Candidatus Neomarinimicrobiota bacterium]